MLAAGACWAAGAGGAEGQTSAATDRAALEAFYDATGGGSQWSGADWKTAVPLGLWQGVSTGGDQRVVHLSLSYRRTGGHLVGSLPGELGSLEKLEALYLDNHIGLTGPIPAELGSLANLRRLDLSETGVSGPIPVELGNLANLETLDLSYAWGLSGRLPPGLRNAPLNTLNIMVTQACAPNEWRDWLKTIRFTGRLCDDDWSATIDLAVVYTPAARAAAGGATEIAALIDLLVAETNRTFAVGGVRHRVELVGRSEVPYVESGMHATDFRRLVIRDDGHLEEAHVLRARVGADLVHLIVDGSRIAIRGVAQQGGPFGLTAHHGGGLVFAHELGHNLGLLHDRGEMAAYSNGRGRDDPVLYSRLLHPAYGWVNPQATLPDVADDRRWRTIMSYTTVCDDFSVVCTWIPRFSNSGQSWNGDPLGAPFGATHSDGTSSASDAAAVLNATGPAAALWRDHVNRAPVQAGWAENLTLRVDDAPAAVEMAGTFRDPDGDPLTCEAVSSAPGVTSVSVSSGCTVTVTPLKADPSSAVVTVTATDAGGLSATQTFFVTVENSPPEARGALPPVTLGLDDAPVALEMAGAFRDPDGDPLILGAVSSAPAVAAAAAASSAVTVTPVDVGTATVTVTATDAGGSNAMAMQTFAVTVEPPNRPPEAAGALPAVTLGLDDAPVSLDAEEAFRDPDGDPLIWEAVSSAPAVASVAVAGSTVTVTPAGAGTTAVIVTATDAGGLSATQTFTVTVLRPFTDDPLRPGTTPIRAVHFTELRSRIDGLRRAAGLARFGWTDPVLRAGVTRVRLAHLLELRQALGGAYAAAERTPPPWTDAAPAAGALPVRAAHLTELRAAVVTLERGRRTPGP